jgi:hypothetical protein
VVLVQRGKAGDEAIMNKYERRLAGIKKARKVLSVYRAINHRISGSEFFEYYEYGGKCEQQLLKTRKPCSCAMCGNPRKHFGEVTIQEKKHNLENEV